MSDPTLPRFSGPSGDAGPASTMSAEHLKAGSLLGGRFRILSEIGNGGFGVVYRAEDWNPENGKAPVLVAIKVPRPGRVDCDSDLQKYRDEADRLLSLRHDNIAEIVARGGTKELPFFLVTRYIEGSNLHDRIHGAHPISFRRAAEWTAAIAEALQYAHDQEILHLDIKPANILLDGADKPYLVDFGLGLSGKDRLKGVVRRGGTEPYMSPEQALGRKVYKTSDIYSLGATLYEMLTKRRPEIPFDPPSKISPEIPEDLEAICLRALAEDRSDRHQTAAEMAYELREFLKNGSPPSRTASPPATSRFDGPLLEYLIDRKKQDEAVRIAWRRSNIE